MSLRKYRKRSLIILIEIKIFIEEHVDEIKERLEAIAYKKLLRRSGTCG